MNKNSPSEIDLFNRVTKITDALNQVTEFTYDAQGNLLTTKDPLNHVTTIAYNAFGQPISVQGPIPSEPPTTFAYDANGNLVTTTDPLGNVTTRTYDAASRLTSLQDPCALFTQFRYDGLNRATEIADARQGITRFDYDPNGNLLSVQDAKDHVTTYTYDNMDRLKTRKDALNRLETYDYDPTGNLSQFTDRKNQQTTFQYDALNRRTQAQYADASTTSFTYDSVGRLAVAEDSLSGKVEFTYDNLDRLMKELTPQGVVNYGYDALGRRTTMTANGQSPVGYQYDAASRLTQVAQGSLSVELGYDAAGRRTSLTYSNGTNTTYSYDNASRVTNITHSGPSSLIEALSYTYDAAGNRIGLTRANTAATLLPQAVQAAYDAANQQIQFNAASPNQIFDADGNLTSDGTKTYTWDARNRLLSINGSGLSASFSYDALGRRIIKSINGQMTQFLYDGNDIVLEIGGSAVGASYIRSLNIDEPFGRQTATGSEFYHVDALGSTLDLTNQAGAVQVNYQYEAFGKTTVTGTSSNPFQYTGRENDGMGLYYYRARYFSPLLHRFLLEDPIGFEAGDLNLYVYVYNNPPLFRDPSGKLLPLLAGILIGVGGLTGGIIEAGAAAFDNQDPLLVAMAFARGVVAGGVGTATGLGLAFLTKNPAIVGAGAGLASNLTSQLLENGFRFDNLSGRKAFFGTLIGAGLGPLGNKIPGLKTRGRLPDPFKPRGLDEFGRNSLRLIGQEVSGGTVGGILGTFVE